MLDELPAVPLITKLAAIIRLSIIWITAAALVAVSIYFGAYQRQLVRIEKSSGSA